MTQPNYSRISITLPPEVLAAADRLAERLDRSRSWVFTEAVRRMIGDEVATSVPSVAPPEPRSLSEPELAQLQADLKLSAEERVLAAEKRAKAAPRISRRPADQILFFNRFEEYLRWDERSRGAS